MSLREKLKKLKNAKYMWDMTRINVITDPNGEGWVKKSDYEYLAKRYKAMYFNMTFLIFGILILALFMMW